MSARRPVRWQNCPKCERKTKQVVRKDGTLKCQSCPEVIPELDVARVTQALTVNA